MAKPRRLTPEKIRAARAWGLLPPAQRGSIAAKARELGIRPQSLVPILEWQTYKDVR